MDFHSSSYIGDDDSLSRQVLPIANLPNDFNGEPEDGMQYLFMVRRDANNLPHTTRVPNPYETGDDPPVSNVTATPALPVGVMPSEEWRSTYEKRFRNFRENLQQPTIHVRDPSSSRSALIPPTLDRVLWWSFLHGKPESEWNPPKRTRRQQRRIQEQESYDRPSKRMRMDEDLEEGEEPEQENPGTRVFTEEGEEIEPHVSNGANGSHSSQDPRVVATPSEREPSFGALSKLNGRQPLQLLRSFTYWINHRTPNPDEPGALIYTVSESHPRWIWCTLAFVEDRLTSDDISILRELARACLTVLRDILVIKDSDVAEGGKKAAWWMIVAAVVGIWGQRDIWLEAEQMVKKVQHVAS